MKRQKLTHCCLRAGLALGMAAIFVSAASAQTWPSKPVRVIVPYPPGGFTDSVARIVTQRLQERLGQPVVIDNKPGANGIIGVDALAKSSHDGYTFAMVIAAHAANTTLYPKLPYDPGKDLRAVSLVGITPLVAGVSIKSPFKSAKEMIEYARKNPGKINYGSSGNGSAGQLTIEYLKSITQTHMVQIVYKGAAAAQTDLMGGQIDLFVDAAPGMLSASKTGKVRMIAVASDKRLPILPDVPTFSEQGFDVIGSTWAGFLAPAGTPDAIVDRVAKEVKGIVGLQEVKTQLEAMGTIPVGGTPAEFDAFIRAETVKWGKVIRNAKVTPDQ